jgi:ABC-type molybdate transport system ATPase subunit
MDSIRNLCKSGVLLENGQVKLRGEIDDVVSAYVSDNLFSVGDVDHITDIAKYRISATTKEYEILEIHRDTPYLVDGTGEIAFTLRIRRNIDNRNFQVQALIDDVADGGNRVGMATSVEMTAPDDKEFTVKIKLPKVNLTRSKYIMDFWVGFGDPTSGIRYYDAAYDTVTFEVASFRSHAINEWHSYWGHNCYELETSIR